MDERHLQSKKPISAALAGPYGHPYHPMLVAVPIGAWVASVVFDIASYLSSSQDAFFRGAMWLIGLGVLGALAAAAVGLMDFLAIPGGTVARRTALLHAGLNLGVTVLFALNFAWRFAFRGSDLATPVGPLILSVVGLLGVSASGYLGGKLAYRYGVRVAAESVQAEGFATPDAVRRRSRPASTTTAASNTSMHRRGSGRRA
ncbi:MAG TPA: DUF2231 domain-containing protein [Propionibacteriaceae bacterium]|nr:DUF2231 domain-containing protein [Propionibacteriaceae bacterium]